MSDVRQHLSASTPAECQKACEFDPRCIAVEWRLVGPYCWLNTEPDHTLEGHSGYDHYHLVSRCSITLGQCFDSRPNVVADVNLLTRKLSYCKDDRAMRPTSDMHGHGSSFDNANQPNPTHHSFTPTHRHLTIHDPTQPNPSMKYIPLHTIATVMSYHIARTASSKCQVKLNQIVSHPC